MTNKTKLIKFCCFSVNTIGYIYVRIRVFKRYISGLKMLKKLKKKNFFSLHKKVCPNGKTEKRNKKPFL